MPKPARRKEPSTYDVVTDVVVGPNLRPKDNLFQAIFILCCIPPPIIAIWFMSQSWLASLLFGTLIGIVAGGLLSGGFLMIYRLFKH